MKNEELVKQLTSPSKNSRLEKFGKTITFLCLALIVFIVAMILLFVAQKGLATFFVNKVSLIEFLFSGDWSPSEGKFGALPMILGSFVVTLLSALVATPFAIGAAIFMTEISPKGAKFLQPAIELLVGIPSVVYGFFGMVVLVPAFRNIFGNGNCVFTASILLGIMILPTIIGVSESAIRAVPDSYYEGSLGLGASHERSVFFAVLPAAKSGILAGIVLGIGRAIGETMAVVMVAGNQAIIPDGMFSGVRTLTSNIVLEMGYATDLHREALIATAVVLFVFILMINLCFAVLKSKEER